MTNFSLSGSALRQSENDINQILGRLDVNFNSNRLNRKRIESIGFRGGIRGNSTNINDESRGTYSTSMNYRRSQFFRPRKYILLGAQGRLDHYTYTSEFEQREDQSIIKTSITLGIGFGRTELVNDAWHFHGISKILKSNELLNETWSNEEFISIAHEIGKIKNTRIIDFRFKEIYEIEQVLSLFEERGFDLSPTSIALFIDAYRFESFVNRFSGNTIEFSLSPYYSHNSKNFGTLPNSRQSILLNLSFDSYNPKSFNWQLDYGASLGLVFGDFFIIDNYGNNTLPNTDGVSFRTNMYGVVSYLPNSRINFSARSALTYSYIEDFLMNQWSARFSFRSQYFLAPRFSINFETSYRLQNVERNISQSNFGFNISGSYAFY